MLNQLGRPDIEALEVLVREAVQNCWDAKRPDVGMIRVEIGRRNLGRATVDELRRSLLVDPPPGLPLGEVLTPGMELLYFADFGTDGLGGPTRADEAGDKRDFVDFVRNIGQPPDKDLGGGSFGYGKAAFYIASRAKTILVDTLCVGTDGRLERRFIGCGLGQNFDEGGRPYTGRHWWGRFSEGVPEPIVGAEAAAAARMVGLPERIGPTDMGTTVVIVAPSVAPESSDGVDHIMDFLADALAWNFWPRMITTPGGTRRTMEFRLKDNGAVVRIPDPRTHPRLRGFVEAMDRLREEPSGDDAFVMDRSIECLRPVRTLGRLVLQKGPVAPNPPVGRAMPQGARVTTDGLHHVALMRNAELVVKYLVGPVPTMGRMGYSGVFRCLVDVDDSFRRAEPPTHDDWIYRSVPRDGHQRTFVKVALERIVQYCREAAGYDGALGAVTDGGGIPLGEFADSLASLMPAIEGTGARRAAAREGTGRKSTRRNAPGRSSASAVDGAWLTTAGEVDEPYVGRDTGSGEDAGMSAVGSGPPMRRRRPETRSAGEPVPALTSDGMAVVRYPFDLRGHGNRVRLAARVEVMTNDGSQVEPEAPVGYVPPTVRGWVDPQGRTHLTASLICGPDEVDGRWFVEVPLRDEAMMRVDIATEIA